MSILRLKCFRNHEESYIGAMANKWLLSIRKRTKQSQMTLILLRKSRKSLTLQLSVCQRFENLSIKGLMHCIKKFITDSVNSDPENKVVSSKLHHYTSSKIDAVWQSGDAIRAFSEIGIFTPKIYKAYKLRLSLPFGEYRTLS